MSSSTVHAPRLPIEVVAAALRHVQLAQHAPQVGDALLEAIAARAIRRVRAAAPKLIVENHRSLRVGALEIEEVVGGYLRAAVEHHERRRLRESLGADGAIPQGAVLGGHTPVEHARQRGGGWKEERQRSSSHLPECLVWAQPARRR